MWFNERYKISIKWLPRHATESLRTHPLLSTISAAFIDHLLNFHFSQFPLRRQPLHIDVCTGRAPWEARVCVRLSPPPSMSVTRVEWAPARGPTFSMPCQSLAVMIWKRLLPHCASQAHMRSSPLNTKSMSFIVSEGYLTREADLLFPAK